MRAWLMVALALGAAPAAAAVTHKDAHGFEVRHEVELKLPPQRAFATLGQIDRWWSDEHSYSGKAANIALELRAGGCMCERWPGGSVEHMRVAVVQPGERLVLTGALGPLLYQGSAGSMEWKFSAIPGGTKVVMTYRVGGFALGNGEGMAAIVDKVLGEQVERLRRFAGE